MSNTLERLFGKGKVSCIDRIKRMNPTEVKETMENDHEGEFVLLDIRQAEEYASGHIPGALSIPLGELEVRSHEIRKRSKVIIYCRSGHMSIGAGVVLCEAGFKNVYVMNEGILNWNYEIVKGQATSSKGGLMVDRKGRRGDLLILAIRLEKGSFDFYVFAQKKAAYEGGAKLFGQLAEMERRHMMKIYNSMDWDVPFTTMDMVLQMQGAKASASEHLEGGSELQTAISELEKREFRDDLEIWETALEREYLSMDFYRHAIGIVDDRDSRILLHSLAEQERSHIDMLSKKLEKLEKHMDSSYRR